MHDTFDRLIARKDAGRSEAEITAAFDRDLSLCLAKVPQKDHRRIRRGEHVLR